MDRKVCPRPAYHVVVPVNSGKIAVEVNAQMVVPVHLKANTRTPTYIHKA